MTGRSLRIFFLVALAVVTTAGPALAQRDRAAEEARSHYERGSKHYNLGRFEEAIKEFELAYEAKPDPVFLFNIAQSHRQKGDAERAIFFYRRYLAMSPDAPNRGEVEKRIVELEEIERKQKETREKPPTSVAKPDDSTPGGKPGGVATGVGGADAGGDLDGEPDPARGGGPEGPGEAIAGSGATAGGSADGQISGGVSTAPAPQTRIGIGAGIGAAIVSFGSLPVDIPVQFTLRLGGAWTALRAGPLAIDVGARLAYTPLPYDTASGSSSTGSLLSVMATGAARYGLTPRIAARAELGLGGQWWGGLEAGNPFTLGGAPTSGALFSPLLGLNLGVEVAVAGSFVITADPLVLNWSPPPENLDEQLDHILSFSLLVGAAYRF